jgi:thiol:disulfide interchange protein DsbC
MKFLLALVLVLLSVAAQAEEAAIRQAFGERYANMPIKSVTKAAIPGLYEIFAGGQILYSDATGDHILMGPLVHTRSRTNLTQQRLDVLKTVKFDSLPIDKAITVVKGKGERKIAVFSDPDCPFCRRLEKELAGLDNLTVHVFLLPLAELHPQAVEISRNMWCADDRAAAWSAYMLEGKKPEGSKNCDTPIEAIATLAGELGISGTPAIVLPSGRRVDGAVPAAKLEALLGGP